MDSRTGNGTSDKLSSNSCSTAEISVIRACGHATSQKSRQTYTAQSFTGRALTETTALIIGSYRRNTSSLARFPSAPCTTNDLRHLLTFDQSYTKPIKTPSSRTLSRVHLQPLNTSGQQSVRRRRFNSTPPAPRGSPHRCCHSSMPPRSSTTTIPPA